MDHQQLVGGGGAHPHPPAPIVIIPPPPQIDDNEPTTPQSQGIPACDTPPDIRVNHAKAKARALLS